MERKSEASVPLHIQRILNATSLDILNTQYETNRDDSDITDEENEVIVDDESADQEDSDEGIFN